MSNIVKKLKIKLIGGYNMSLETMLEIYKINQKEMEEFNIKHNKFLSDRNITNAEFEYRINKMRSDRIDQVIRNANNHINRYS